MWLIFSFFSGKEKTQGESSSYFWMHWTSGWKQIILSMIELQKMFADIQERLISDLDGLLRWAYLQMPGNMKLEYAILERQRRMIMALKFEPEYS